MAAGQKMLVAIANHACTDGVRTLRAGLCPHVETIALDSGSPLSADDTKLFARCLPNVYYNGLLNAAYAQMRAHGADILYFICSDVSLPDPAAAVRRAQATFAAPDVGIYAPSMNASGHYQMRRRATGALRRVSFVEGACFAARAPLLAALCPIDLRLNALGWGTDVYLGYLAWHARWATVVDDAVIAVHRGVCGYDTRRARAQRDAWFAQQSRAARRFRCVSGWAPCKTQVGWRLADPLLRLASYLGRV